MASSSAPKSFINNLEPNDEKADVVIKSGSSTKTWKVHKQVLLITSGRLFDIANSNPSIVLQNTEDNSIDLLVDYITSARRYTSLHRLAETFDIRELRTLVHQAFDYWFQSEPLSCDLVKSVLDATFARGYILPKVMEQLIFDCVLKMLRKPSKWNIQAWNVMKRDPQYRVFTANVQSALSIKEMRAVDHAIERGDDEELKRQAYDGDNEDDDAAL